MTALEDEVRELRQIVEELRLRMISVGSLGDFGTNDLGDMEHGSFTVKTMDGLIRMILSGEDLYDLIGIHCHFIGFNDNGEAQFWVNAEEGTLDFAEGAGRLTRLGILMTGLNFVIRQTATNEAGENQRVGYLEMFVAPGGNVPSWGMTYSDNPGSLVVNGDFETGDLTGWNTEDDDIFEVRDDTKISGEFGLLVHDVESGTKTLLSDRFAVDASKPYRISIATREHAYISQAARLVLSIRNLISDDTPAPAGEFSLGETNKVYRALASFEGLPSDLSLLMDIEAVVRAYHTREDASNDRNVVVFRMLRAWTANADWNTYDGVNAWGAAGASDTDEDREAVSIGSLPLLASEANGWKEIPIDTAALVELATGTLDNNGLILQMETEADDGHTFSTNPFSVSGDLRPVLNVAYQTQSHYAISIHFYDAEEAGSLLGTTVLCTEANQAALRIASMFVQPPAGATHAAVELVVDAGYGFQVDDISISYSTSIHFDDKGLNFSGRRFLHHNLDEGVIGRFPSAVAHLHPPYTTPTVVGTLFGNLAAGSVFYQVAFYDNDGTTTLGGATTPVSIGGVYGGASLTNIPIGPYGTVGRALFRQYVGDPTKTYRIDLANNTSTSYIDYGDGDDPEKDSALPTVNTTLGRPVLPRRATLWWDEGIRVGNWDVTLSSSFSYYYYWVSTPGAIGHYIEFSFYLEAGTYKLKTLGRTNNNRSYLDYILDGTVVIDNQDWYASSAVNNVVKTAQVTVPTSGYHTMRIVAAGKHASSSNYDMSGTKTWFEPVLD